MRGVERWSATHALAQQEIGHHQRSTLPASLLHAQNNSTQSPWSHKKGTPVRMGAYAVSKFFRARRPEAGREREASTNSIQHALAPILRFNVQDLASKDPRAIKKGEQRPVLHWFPFSIDLGSFEATY